MSVEKQFSDLEIGNEMENETKNIGRFYKICCVHKCFIIIVET